MSSPDGALTAGAPTPGTSVSAQLSRAFRMFTEPAAAFRELAGKPVWVVALLILVTAGFAVQAVVAPRIDMESTIRQSMEEKRGGRPSDAELEQAVSAAEKVGKVTMWASPLVAALMFLAVAVAYFLGLKVLGSDGRYVSVFSAYLHAIFPPSLVSSLLMGVVALQRDTFAAQELKGMVKSSLAGWLPAETPKPAMALAESVDVFNLWQWILLVLGFEIVGRVSRGKAILLVAVVWGVWVLGKVALAAVL